jgi:hypothetical protein
MRAALRWRRPLPLRRWHAIVDFEDKDEDNGIGGDDDYHSSRDIGVVPLDDVVARGMTPDVASSSYDGSYASGYDDLDGGASYLSHP